MVERCALSGSDLKIKFRTILLTSIEDIEDNEGIQNLTTYCYYRVFKLSSFRNSS